MSNTTPSPNRGSSRTGQRGQRADAQRNHERITAAALAVFAERGLDATVPEVAQRAGVGKATVYRNYPTKADLVEAVAQYQLQWVAQRIEEAVGQPDTYQALRSFFGDLAERLAHDRVLAELLPQEPSEGNMHIRELVGVLVTRAREDGRLRAEVTPTDFQVLFGGFTRQLRSLDDRDPSNWRRYSDIVVDALSAPNSVDSEQTNSWHGRQE